MIDDQRKKIRYTEHFGKLTTTIYLEKWNTACNFFPKKGCQGYTNWLAQLSNFGLQLWYDLQLTGEVVHGFFCIVIHRPAVVTSRAWFSLMHSIKYFVMQTVYFFMLLKYICNNMQQLIVHTRLAINVTLIIGRLMYPSVFWIPPPHHPSSRSLAGCHPHRRLASSNGTHPWKQCNHWSHMVLEVAASSKKAPRCHPLGKPPSFPLLVAFPEIGGAWGRHRQRWGNSVLYIQ